MNVVSGYETDSLTSVLPVNAFLIGLSEASRVGPELERKNFTIKENFARCDRLYNSTLFYLRRWKNGKEGKRYEKRNKE